jgi:hypothetical protein
VEIAMFLVSAVFLIFAENSAFADVPENFSGGDRSLGILQSQKKIQRACETHRPVKQLRVFMRFLLSFPQH